eukprot:2994908-Pyramimonas_sp.AAC.1
MEGAPDPAVELEHARVISAPSHIQVCYFGRFGLELSLSRVRVPPTAKSNLLRFVHPLVCEAAEGKKIPMTNRPE